MAYAKTPEIVELEYHFNSLPEIEQQAHRCRRLWFAVLLLVFSELRGVWFERYAQDIFQAQAYSWFKTRHCRIICDLSGIEYEVVLNVFYKYFDKKEKKIKRVKTNNQQMAIA